MITGRGLIRTTAKISLCPFLQEPNIRIMITGRGLINVRYEYGINLIKRGRALQCSCIWIWHKNKKFGLWEPKKRKRILLKTGSVGWWRPRNLFSLAQWQKGKSNIFFYAFIWRQDILRLRMIYHKLTFTRRSGDLMKSTCKTSTCSWLSGWSWDAQCHAV